MRTSNPVMQTFLKPQTWADLEEAKPRHMTMNGTITATLILICLCAAAAVATYSFLGTNLGMLYPVMIGSCLGAFVGGFIIFSAPKTAPFLAPVFALVEGALAGAISLVVAELWLKDLKPGLVGETIILQAVLLTFGILFALLLGYRAGLVRLGSTAQKCVIVATAGVMVYYLVGLVISLFVPTYTSLGWNTGWLGIGFSLFVVVLASLNLVLDFQFIEAGVTNKAPKHMEWYGGFALLVTLVWLYIETLRLLAKLAASRD